MNTSELNYNYMYKNEVLYKIIIYFYLSQVKYILYALRLLFS